MDHTSGSGLRGVFCVSCLRLQRLCSGVGFGARACRWHPRNSFCPGTPQRQRVVRRLEHIYALAKASGHLARLIVFGSFVTAKAASNWRIHCASRCSSTFLNSTGWLSACRAM